MEEALIAYLTKKIKHLEKEIADRKDIDVLAYFSAGQKRSYEDVLKWIKDFK